jgi:hypothetical protein
MSKRTALRKVWYEVFVRDSKTLQSIDMPGRYFISTCSSNFRHQQDAFLFAEKLFLLVGCGNEVVVWQCRKGNKLQDAQRMYRAKEYVRRA